MAVRPFRLFPLTLPLLLTGALMLFCPPAAHAGSWSVTYETSGANTGEIASSGEYVVGKPWATNSSSNHLFLDMTDPPWGDALDDISTEGT